VALSEVVQRGPVGALLAALSVLAVALLLERGLFWLRERSRQRGYDPAHDLAALRGEAERPNSADPPALGRVLRRVRPGSGAPRSALEAALGLEDLHLRRGLVVVEAVVAIAPMLGILGTVLGLMEAFEGLGATTRDPRLVIGGLSSALLTTALGLSVALAGILPVRLLHARAELALREVESDLAGLGLASDEAEGPSGV